MLAVAGGHRSSVVIVEGECWWVGGGGGEGGWVGGGGGGEGGRDTEIMIEDPHLIHLLLLLLYMEKVQALCVWSVPRVHS